MFQPISHNQGPEIFHADMSRWEKNDFLRCLLFLPKKYQALGSIGDDGVESAVRKFFDDWGIFNRDYLRTLYGRDFVMRMWIERFEPEDFVFLPTVQIFRTAYWWRGQKYAIPIENIDHRHHKGSLKYRRQFKDRPRLEGHIEFEPSFGCSWIIDAAKFDRDETFMQSLHDISSFHLRRLSLMFLISIDEVVLYVLRMYTTRVNRFELGQFVRVVRRYWDADPNLDYDEIKRVVDLLARSGQVEILDRSNSIMPNLPVKYHENDPLEFLCYVRQGVNLV